MAWRTERWEDIVARAASATPHARRIAAESEDRASLAARAQPWTFAPKLEIRERGIVVGSEMDSVEIALAQLYHLEPVDPWPSLAIGWVEAGQPGSTVLTPTDEDDHDAFAARVEELVSVRAKGLSATAPGWLAYPVLTWERVEALPGEREEGPAMRGYRLAPAAVDPVVARRTTRAGARSLWTWIWSRRRTPPRRVDPQEIVLTEHFVYVRTRGGDRLRLPVDALRTSRRTEDGDTIYVLGRNTEILLVHQEGCEVARALDARLGSSHRLRRGG